MTRFVHRLSLTFYFIVVLLTIGLLTYIGFSYYRLPMEERFFHPLYKQLSPTGIIGHGLGIFGSLIMLFGLFSYMGRKRLKVFSRLGALKYWLEFHIFLCTLGPVMIMFHTSFKFGGIVSVGFWSMAIVWSSGVIGRFIYLQIPRTIEGRELSLREVEALKDQQNEELQTKYNINLAETDTSKFSVLKMKLQSEGVSKRDFKKVKHLIDNEKKLNRRIARLDKMKNLFKYWHFAHLPFALILIIIMLIHIVVVFTFGYSINGYFKLWNNL